MILNNSFKLIKKKIRHFYLNSNLYNKKITPSSIELMEYQPSPNLLDCLIKYDKKKINIENYSLNDIDLVLIMSVNPGFGGQKFMPEVLEKIKELKEIRDQKNLDFDIEIDGGINFDNNKLAIEAGANILVSGTTIFKNNNGDIKKNIDLLKSSQNNDFK